MATSAAVPSLRGTIPASHTINQIDASDGGDVVFSTIEDDQSTKLYKVLDRGEPFMLDGTGGNPMRVSGYEVYYGTPTGLKRVATTDHGVYTPESLTAAVPDMSAIAVTDSDVYYVAGTCIFRRSKN